MTFENAFNNLSEIIGEEFNWFLLPKNNNIFEEEAEREIGKEHFLYGYSLKAIAKCENSDDVLFKLNNDQYVIIHLTYNTSNSASYPKYIIFKNFIEVLEYIEEMFFEYYDNNY